MAMRWQSIAAYGACVATLSACSPQTIQSGGDAGIAAADPAGSPSSLPAAGAVRRGDSFAQMAEQYTPRRGPFAATGASAWVPPAPAPAFVATGPRPPADPPAPP